MRKATGYFLLASPFLSIGAALYAVHGIFPVLVTFGTTAFLVGVIFAGVWLIDP